MRNYEEKAESCWMHADPHISSMVSVGVALESWQREGYLIYAVGFFATKPIYLTVLMPTHGIARHRHSCLGFPDGYARERRRDSSYRSSWRRFVVWRSFRR